VGRLDRNTICTRLVRQGILTTGRLQIARPRVESLDPSYPTTLSQKSEHLMQLPTTPHHHGYSCDRCGNNTCVSPCFFTAHPGMGGENLSLCTPYRALFHHRPPSGKDTTRSVPHNLGIRPYPLSLDPASTRPRHPSPVSKKEEPTWHRTPGLFTASSPTSSRCPRMASHS
jgi:hypothetical protein